MQSASIICPVIVVMLVFVFVVDWLLCIIGLSSRTSSDVLVVPDGNSWVFFVCFLSIA